jgi:Ca-activated chloride channel homolog
MNFILNINNRGFGVKLIENLQSKAFVHRNGRGNWFWPVIPPDPQMGEYIVGNLRLIVQITSDLLPHLGVGGDNQAKSTNFQNRSNSLCLMAFAILFLFLNTNLISQNPAHENLVKGDTQYEKKEYKKAEEHYRKAIEKAPEKENATYNLGNSVYQQGRYDQALDLYERAAKNAKTNDDKADAHYNLGNTHYKKNEYQKAVDNYKESLRLRPKDPDLKQNLRLATEKLKQQKEQQKKQEQQQKDQKQDPNQQNQPKDPKQDQPKPGEKDKPKDQGKPEESKDAKDQNQAQQGQKKSEQEAKRILETMIEPEDQKNGKKYRTKPRQRQKPEKDW